MIPTIKLVVVFITLTLPTKAEYLATTNFEVNVDGSSTDLDNNMDKNDFGESQKITGTDEEISKTQKVIQKMENYFRNEVNVKPEYDSVRDKCKNRNELCAFWASIGECKKNPKFMTLECAAACRTCDQIDISNRCPLNPNAPEAVGPGDLDKFFERVSDEKGEFGVYGPKVLSQPYDPDKKLKDATYKEGPWVVTFDNFLTSEECDTLVDLGHEEGFKRSSDVGAVKYDGTFEEKISSGRTSENAWCLNTCYKNPVAKRVMEKIHNLTGFPEDNSEYLQLLKYRLGQRYNEHHDFIEGDERRQHGPRVLTLFLYLNDVEEGGGTNFPLLDIKVMPKKGKALLCPNVLNEDPSKKDGRTIHAAMPVEKGIKYEANAWLHLRDFKGPLERGC